MIATLRLDVQAMIRRKMDMFYIQRARRVNNPMVRRMAPLKGGIHWPKGRRAKNLGMVAAAVPAINSGSTCPKPKELRRTIPIAGLPVLAIHPSKTARTGVVQGDAASPNARPADSGANGPGTFPCQIAGSGPWGKGIFNIPSKLSPMIIANRATKTGTNPGTWP